MDTTQPDVVDSPGRVTIVLGTSLGVPVNEPPVESVARSTVVEGTRSGKLVVLLPESATGLLLTVVTTSASTAKLKYDCINDGVWFQVEV